MSTPTPKKALSALMPLSIRIDDSTSVAPMTLGMWAALERIGSPLVGANASDEPADVLAYIPSLYLLTHGAKEIFRGNIIELAMAWADTVPVHMMALIRDAAFRQIRAASDVMPEDDDAEKKKMTDGSQASRIGRLALLAGAIKRYFGRCRFRRSSSCAARPVATRTAP